MPFETRSPKNSVYPVIHWLHDAAIRYCLRRDFRTLGTFEAIAHRCGCQEPALSTLSSPGSLSLRHWFQPPDPVPRQASQLQSCQIGTPMAPPQTPTGKRGGGAFPKLVLLRSSSPGSHCLQPSHRDWFLSCFGGPWWIQRPLKTQNWPPTK